MKGSKLADIWQGTYDGRRVVIKALRPVFSLDNLKTVSPNSSYYFMSYPSIDDMQRSYGVATAFSSKHC
jgi:hypothetical protein